MTRPFVQMSNIQTDITVTVPISLVHNSELNWEWLLNSNSILEFELMSKTGPRITIRIWIKGSRITIQ